VTESGVIQRKQEKIKYVIVCRRLELVLSLQNVSSLKDVEGWPEEQILYEKREGAGPSNWAQILLGEGPLYQKPAKEKNMGSLTEGM